MRAMERRMPCPGLLDREGRESGKASYYQPVPLTITQHFSGFADINDLRKRLRQTGGLQLFNDNFSQYSEQFRRLSGEQR